MKMLLNNKYRVCMFLCFLAFLLRSEAFRLSKKPVSRVTSPRRDVSVEKLHIRSDVTYRFAITEVVSDVHNNANVSKEARFDVRLPKTAFISNFTMVIDGVEYPGHVDEKERAREQYETARRRGQSAGYVGVQPRNTDRFKVAVNVAPNSTVTFKLIYDDLLQRRLGLYEHVTYIDPGQIVPDMRVDVLIVENHEITELSIPNIRNDLITDFEITDENPYAEILSISDSSVHISFAPSPSQQRDIAENGIAGQFIVNYDVKRDFKGGEILLANGYFVHFFAPPDLVPMPKSIMFALDVSGSMYRQKLKQLKDAMESILQDLNPGDDFNIVKFSSRVSMWKNKMVPVSERLLVDAMGYTRRLVARGSTNINDALLKALSFRPFIDTRKVPMVFFLTDGNPTVGETDEDRLLTNVIRTNKYYFKGKAAIFCLAFGSDADFELVKSISSTNNGIARKIYTDADASLQLAGFYEEISVPLLSDVHIKYLDPVLEQESITRARSQTYFFGSELVMAGRIADDANDNDTATIDLFITGNDVDGSFVIDEPVIPEVVDFNPATADRLLSITERMWAYLTIKQLLEDSKYLDMQELKANLTSEALRLALKYGFVTELTSMVVTKPDNKMNELARSVDPQIDLKPLMPMPTPPMSQSVHPRRRPMMPSRKPSHSPIHIGGRRPGMRRPSSRGWGIRGNSGNRGSFGMKGRPSFGGPSFAMNSVVRGSSRGMRRRPSSNKYDAVIGPRRRIVTVTTRPRPNRRMTTVTTTTRAPEVMTPRFPPVAVVPVPGQSGWENLCIFRLSSQPGQVVLLSTKDIMLSGTLAPVIKAMVRGRRHRHPAFIRVNLNLPGSQIQMTTSRVKVGNVSLPWWRTAFINESDFQVNITSSKQFVITTDNGLHLVVSRVGLRSRRSRSKPYLSVALLDVGSIDTKNIQGAFKTVMLAKRIVSSKPALSLIAGRYARLMSTRPRSLADGESCWQLANARDRFTLVKDELGLRLNS